MRGVEKRYGGVAAVAGVDLEIDDGETFVLVGESGCGKTTLLRMINRLVIPSAGRLEVLGQDVEATDAPALRRRIGYVIQDVGLFDHFTVMRNVEVVPRLLGWSQRKTRERCRELLDLVGLPADRFADRYPRHLSGGQQQRVGIARALAADPPLVLLDEPFGALDPITREHMQDEFVALSRRMKKTFVLVTHDVFEAVRLADRIGVMQRGRLIRRGSPRELVRDPGHPHVADLLGRHLFQLRLMTIRLSAVPSPAGPGGDEEAPDLPEDASVWDALTSLEASAASGVRVGGVRWLSRQTLVAAATEE